MISLIVVRHGETDWNRIRRLQGHTDIALNAAGLEQAERLADALAGESIASVHSSDLARALATARPVATALELPIVTNPLLRERNYGVLEGKTFGEILEHHPDEAERLRVRDATHRIANGESQEEFHRRVIDAFTAIATTEEALADPATVRKTLVVTHGGVLDMLYRSAHAVPLEAERAWPISNAVINRLRYDDGRFTVESWGEAT